MKKFAIIVAGGKGTRMGTNIPKQFLLINYLPVLMHTINAFCNFEKHINIIVVLPSEQIDYWKELCKKYNFEISHKITEGGETRFHSVKNGLKLTTENSLIAVHDGVRPLVSNETIKKCFLIAEEKGNAIPAIHVVESVRKITDNNNFPIDRSELRLIQTPQVFKSEILNEAYEQSYLNEFTDDASVVEKTGVKINLVEGNKENIKITDKVDLVVAEFLFNK